MIAIVYISAAVQPLSDADLEALLAKSREKNARLKVTGILLYKDGDIMQLIEGPGEAVRNWQEQSMRIVGIMASFNYSNAKFQHESFRIGQWNFTS